MHRRWSGSRSQTHGFNPRTGASYSDIRGAMKRRQLAQWPGVINEFADRGRLGAANCDGSGHDGHADTEAAAAFLFEVFLGRIVLRGCVIAMRMVAAGLGMMMVGLNLMIVRLN
ncbi:hypothetical protein predicted by Glimmer/Critica (plasmid) [Sinorhizobium fredii HH103]|uniref:Uncharacterized protein n=1 Tax=Sinorhizobium fredii (strain HH103) TaxID=1117943 RepID=G9AHP0_SINF1|nr:hypothetical protein predicted by Glimmer/Critica [Sinorhizobium fredii HH103]